jgi:glucan phosphoethanolaminetransferase (alkaline phosphatase superfamily)
MTCGVVATSISGCDVCTACRVVCDCSCHNAACHITMYFYWLIPQYCGFSKAQHTPPEDGPIGPKHVGANIEIFLLYILTFYVFNKRVHLLVKRILTNMNVRMCVLLTCVTVFLTPKFVLFDLPCITGSINTRINIFHTYFSFHMFFFLGGLD